MNKFLKYYFCIFIFSLIIPSHAFGFNCFSYQEKEVKKQCGSPISDNYLLCSEKVRENVLNSFSCKQEIKKNNENIRNVVLKVVFFGLLGLGGMYILLGRIAEILNSIFKFSGINKNYRKNSWENFKKNMESKKKSYSKTAKNEYNKSDIDERLQRLKKLLDDQIITREEYEEQRKQIIGDI